MPFKSEKQRRFMHAQHPEIADRWERKYGPPKKGSKKKRKHPALEGLRSARPRSKDDD